MCQRMLLCVFKCECLNIFHLLFFVFVNKINVDVGVHLFLVSWFPNCNGPKCLAVQSYITVLLSVGKKEQKPTQSMLFLSCGGVKLVFSPSVFSSRINVFYKVHVL